MCWAMRSSGRGGGKIDRKQDSQTSAQDFLLKEGARLFALKKETLGIIRRKGGSNMEIIQDDAKKLVQVWLSRKESGDEALQSRLKPMYAQWKQQKYMVAVFHSGQEDLKENTMALLAYNKRRSAELAVQREKKQRRVSMER